jgi:hypothetical protein
MSQPMHDAGSAQAHKDMETSFDLDGRVETTQAKALPPEAVRPSGYGFYLLVLCIVLF